MPLKLVSSDYAYTWYYYPLEKPIKLSDQLGFELDNPRTEQEISDTALFLIQLADSGSSYFQLIAKSSEDVEAIENLLFRFRAAFAETDPVVAKRFQSYKRDNIIEFIARMLVIVRYEGDEEIGISSEEIEKLQEGKKGVAVLEPLVTNRDRLEDLSYLLSLLIHTNEDYWGHNFIIEPNSMVMHDDAWYNFFQLGLLSPVLVEMEPEIKEDWRWHFFSDIKADLLTTSKKFDELFANGDSEKLLYIGNLLRLTGREAHDAKMKVLLLTSALELLLTHNPDYNRFNVEDSINKQFQLKLGTLLYHNDPNINLQEVKSRLKAIYQARSNIAHGNFGELAKTQKMAIKKGETEFDVLQQYTSYLYHYLQVTLWEYLRNKAFVDFLKES